MDVSLNLIGLLFNIIGAILVWRYGLPANISSDGSVRITRVLGGEQTDSMKRTEKKIKRGRIASNLGMLMIITGFILQAWVELSVKNI